MPLLVCFETQVSDGRNFRELFDVSLIFDEFWVVLWNNLAQTAQMHAVY